MSLIKLTDTSGNVAHVNPDHVVFVSSALEKGVLIFDVAGVVLVGGAQMLVKGTPDEVADKLRGKENGSCLTL